MSDAKCDKYEAPAGYFKRERGAIHYGCASHAGVDWKPIGALGGGLLEIATASAEVRKALGLDEHRKR